MNAYGARVIAPVNGDMESLSQERGMFYHSGKIFSNVTTWGESPHPEASEGATSGYDDSEVPQIDPSVLSQEDRARFSALDKAYETALSITRGCPMIPMPVEVVVTPVELSNPQN